MIVFKLSQKQQWIQRRKGKLPQTIRGSHRRPTMPMCLQDKEELSEFIRSKEDLTTINDETVKDQTKPVSLPKKRSLKRTDSYRAATTKGNSIQVSDPTETFKKEDYKKEQYKSLPSEMIKSKKRNRIAPKSGRVRVLRQESGIMPSPDTDDDQKSVVSDRKKKSTLQKAKERLVHTFRKQSLTDEEKSQKKRDKLAQKQMKKRKRAPSDITQSLTDIATEVSSKAVTRSDSKRSKKTHGILEPNGENTIRFKEVALLRKSFSQSKSKKSEKDNKLTESQSSQKSSRENSQSSPETSVRKTPVQHTEDDHVNQIFREIVLGDLERSENRKKRSSNFSLRNRTEGKVDGGVGDRSTLSLDLQNTHPLKYHATKHVTKWREETVSPDGSIRRHFECVRLSSDIEIDGGEDCFDGQSSESQNDQTSKASHMTFDKLSYDEKEKRTSDVANRLRALADKYVAKIESESGQSEGEVERIVSPIREEMEVIEQLVSEFRKEGDRLSRELDLESNLTPLILKVAQQATYDSFKAVINQSLRDTIGWEQIAMFYYLTKTAIHVAGASRSLARMTADYFQERYSAWVSQKGGWESMMEETDSELD